MEPDPTAPSPPLVKGGRCPNQASIARQALGDMPVKARNSRLNMPLLMHANSEAAQAFGLEAGVDAFAHGIWRWTDGGTAAPPAKATAILDAVIARRIGWQPTFQVLYGERDLFDPELLADPELARVVPRPLLDWYATEDGRWWRSRMLRGGATRAAGEAFHRSSRLKLVY